MRHANSGWCPADERPDGCSAPQQQTQKHSHLSAAPLQCTRSGLRCWAALRRRATSPTLCSTPRPRSGGVALQCIHLVNCPPQAAALVASAPSNLLRTRMLFDYLTLGHTTIRCVLLHLLFHPAHPPPGRLFGSKVKYWATFNEINVTSFAGFIYGSFTPGKVARIHACGQHILNMLRAHTQAYNAIKAMPGGQRRSCWRVGSNQAGRWAGKAFNVSRRNRERAGRSKEAAKK